ncbi:MAG: tetratricopeptide repeat protein, partial [Pseudomonadota bacterium]
MALTRAAIPQAFQRALAMQRGGRAEEALALYTQILMVRPETAEARFQIGRIHAAANRGDKAAEAFRAALR